MLGSTFVDLTVSDEYEPDAGRHVRRAIAWEVDARGSRSGKRLTMIREPMLLPGRPDHLVIVGHEEVETRTGGLAQVMQRWEIVPAEPEREATKETQQQPAPSEAVPAK